MFARTILLVAFTTLSAPAWSQAFEFALESRNELASGVTSSTRGASVLYSWQGQLRLGLLAGEPTVSLRVKWNLEGATVTVPTLSPGRALYETRNLDDLPQIASELVRLYDLELRLRLAGGNGQTADLLVDAGYLGKTGEWSFNVPGSPDWDAFFLARNTDDNFYGEQWAKSFWESGFDIQDVMIEDIRISLGDLHSWYRDSYPRAEIDVYDTALRRLGRGLQLSYGYDTTRLDLLLAEPLPADDQAEMEALLEKRKILLTRLMTFGPATQQEEDSAAYNQARSDVMTILERFAELQLSFQQEGVSVENDREKGQGVTFETARSLQLGRTSTGKKFVFDPVSERIIRRLSSYDQVAGNYVIRGAWAGSIHECRPYFAAGKMPIQSLVGGKGDIELGFKYCETYHDFEIRPLYSSYEERSLVALSEQTLADWRASPNYDPDLFYLQGNLVTFADTSIAGFELRVGDSTGYAVDAATIYVFDQELNLLRQETVRQ